MTETEDEYILKNTMYEEYNAENSINAKDIQSTIDNLEDDYRIPFQLFVDGYKYKEIADKTNLPIGTVKSRIFFARRQLMENLESFK